MSTDPTNRNAAIHERPVLKLVKRMDEEHELRRTAPEIAKPRRLILTWADRVGTCEFKSKSTRTPDGVAQDLDALRWLADHEMNERLCGLSGGVVVMVSEDGHIGIPRFYLVTGSGSDFHAERQP